MEGVKQRSVSAGSTNSSITEFVNKAFEDSELQQSDAVSVEILNGAGWYEDSMRHIASKDGNKNLKNFSDADNTSHESQPKKFRMMYLATLSVLIFPICMGMTGTYTATALPNMKKVNNSLTPTSSDSDWIGSLMALGALLGGSAAGFATNTLGRKGALVFNTALYVVGWLLITYAQKIAHIFAGRIITGFCTGIVSMATPMYLVEISTPEVRGLLGASFQLFVVIGVLLVSLLGSMLNWRWLAASGAMFSLLAAFLMVPMPESPRWLMSQKRTGEAKNAMKFLQGKDFDADAECQEIELEINNQPKGRIQFKEVLTPAFYKPFILSMLLMFFQQFSGVNAILFYCVEIFNKASKSLDPTTATIIVATVQVIATLFGSLLMDKAGRKILLMISATCMSLSMFVFGGYEYASVSDATVKQTYGVLPLVCLMSFIAAFSIGYGPTPWLMVAEMTSVRFRGFISGIATAFNWTLVFIITLTFGGLQRVIHAYGVYWLFGSICAISCFVTHFFLPETKGKTIEEIQNSFQSKKKEMS